MGVNWNSGDISAKFRSIEKLTVTVMLSTIIEENCIDPPLFSNATFTTALDTSPAELWRGRKGGQK
jgi:hypothetical protein